jgi:hypothetical protein
MLRFSVACITGVQQYLITNRCWAPYSLSSIIIVTLLAAFCPPASGVAVTRYTATQSAIDSNSYVPNWCVVARGNRVAVTTWPHIHARALIRVLHCVLFAVFVNVSRFCQRSPRTPSKNGSILVLFYNIQSCAFESFLSFFKFKTDQLQCIRLNGKLN